MSEFNRNKLVEREKFVNPYEAQKYLWPEVLFPPDTHVIYIANEHNPNQRLMLFGTIHLLAAEHEQYDMMERGFGIFHRDTNKKIKMLAEGRIPTEIQDWERDSAIEAMGERAHLQWLAKKYNVDLTTGEAPNYIESRILLDMGFNPEHVLYYYTLRHIPQWYRSSPEQRIQLIPHLKAVFENYKRNVQEQNPHVQLDHIIFESLWDIHEELFAHNEQYPRIFDMALDESLFALDQTIKFWDTTSVIQQISMHCNKARDEHLLGMIQRLWSEGYSIFGNYGWQHTMNLEPQLLKLGRSVEKNYQDPLRDKIDESKYRTGFSYTEIPPHQKDGVLIYPY